MTFKWNSGEGTQEKIKRKEERNTEIAGKNGRLPTQLKGREGRDTQTLHPLLKF